MRQTSRKPRFRMDRTPLVAKRRVQARTAYLQDLNLSDTDLDSIVREITARIKEARSITIDIQSGKGKRKVLHEIFLSKALAIYLLASEPQEFRFKLARTCLKPGAAGQINTSLLTLVLKEFGPYAAKGRRTWNRDGLVLEYLIVMGKAPSDIVSYLQTRGQGLDATYRRAMQYFKMGNRDKPMKVEMWMTPQVYRRYVEREPHQPLLVYINDRESRPTALSCLHDPAKIKQAVRSASQSPPKA